jgi:hypothetical protein
MNYTLYYKIAHYLGSGFEALFYGTLYKHSLIVYCELISFP